MESLACVESTAVAGRRCGTRAYNLVTAVSGKPLGGIGRDLYHALFGVFSVAD